MHREDYYKAQEGLIFLFLYKIILSISGKEIKEDIQGEEITTIKNTSMKVHNLKNGVI